MENYMKLEVPAKSCNESFVRAAVSAFAVQLDLSIEDMADIKTAVSEAVTNSIEHGYNLENKGEVQITIKLGELDSMTYFWIQVIDQGVGIENIELATTPTYTTKPELEHAGMGFTIMETFMDEVVIDSRVNEGTSVIMTKKLKTMKS